MSQIARHILLIACGLVHCAVAAAQHGAPLWTTRYGSVSFEELNDLVELPNGDFLAVGNTSSPGPGAGLAGNLTQDPPVGGDFGEGPDLLVVRFDVDGNPLWERRIGGQPLPVEVGPTSSDGAMSAAVDANGDLVIVGTSNSDPAPGVPGAKQAPNIGDSDLWVVKLAPNGSIVWDQTYGGTGFEMGNGVAVLPNGNYVLTGTRQPDPQRPINQSATEDIYVVQVAPDGTLVREDTYGGDHYDRTWSTLQLASGEIIVGGASASAADPTMGKSLDTYGNSDIYLVHLDASGAYLRDYQFGSRYTEQPFALTETSDGAVFVSAESFFDGETIPGGSDPPTRDVAVAGPVGPAGGFAGRDVYYLAFEPTPARTIRYDGVYGGSNFDVGYEAAALPNGCVALVGSTLSGDRAMQESGATPVGKSDAWLVYINATGEVTADVLRGGAAGDNADEVIRSSDGTLLIGGISGSGPFEWNPDGAFIGDLPEANTMYFTRLACTFEVTLPADDVACQGQSIDLANEDELASDACMDWTWTDASGAVLSDQPILTLTPTAPQTITLESTGPDGCVRSDVIELDLAPGVVPVISNVNEPTCDDPNGSFDVRAPGATSILVELGNPPEQYTITGDAGTVSNLVAGNYTITAITADPNCAPAESLTLNSSTLGRTYAISSNQGDVCLGDPIDFVSDFTGLVTFNIVAPDGTLICDETSPGGCSGATYVPTATGMQTFTFAGANADGCPVSGQHQVTVHEAASLSVASRIEPTCGDATGEISGTFVGTEISLDGGQVQTGGTFSYTGLGEGTYTLLVRSTDPRCSFTEQIVLSPSAPFALPELEDIAVCVGEAIPPVQPSGLTDPSITGYSWFDEDTQQAICDCAALTIPSAQPSSRTISLVVETTDGCQYRRSFKVDVYAVPELVVAATDESCGALADGSLNVTTTADELLVNGTLYPATPVIGGLPPGEYQVTAVSPLERCSAEVTETIGPGETFELDLGDDEISVIAGETITLDAGLSDPSAYTISWSGIPLECSDCPTQTFLVPGDLEVSVTAVSAAGCSRSDRVSIDGRQDRSIFVPNVFSPNGDQRNDTFEPRLSPFVASTGSLRIFDRWGNTVYVSRPSEDQVGQEGWDGMYDREPAATGVYTYIMPVTYITGETRVLRGDVTLLR